MSDWQDHYEKAQEALAKGDSEGARHEAGLAFEKALSAGSGEGMNKAGDLYKSLTKEDTGVMWSGFVVAGFCLAWAYLVNWQASQPTRFVLGVEEVDIITQLSRQFYWPAEIGLVSAAIFFILAALSKPIEKLFSSAAAVTNDRLASTPETNSTVETENNPLKDDTQAAVADEAQSQAGESKKYQPGMGLVIGGLIGLYLLVSLWFKYGQFEIVSIASWLLGTLIGTAGFALFCEFVLSTIFIPQPTAPPVDDTAKNMIHQRFYQGIPIEDAWKKSMKAFKENRSYSTKPWTIDGIDDEEKSYLVHYHDVIEPGQYCQNVSNPRYSVSLQVEVHMQGKVMLQELEHGTFINFVWNMIRQPRQMEMNEESIAFVDNRFESIWLTAYQNIDALLGQPVLGGISPSGETPGSAHTIDAAEAIHRKRLDT